MSFFNCNNTGIKPGVIRGSALTGLCQRACISVEKVLDACLTQTTEPNTEITITNQNPANPTDPLTYVSAQSTTDNPATISNLVVERLEEQPRFARVSCTVTIPIVVTYIDANNVQGTADSQITRDLDVILFVPQPSIMPYQISVEASCRCPDGVYSGDDVFTVTACYSIILKVIAKTDLLVPTYGNCQIPPCTPYTADICNAFFNLPLYPAGTVQ